MTVACRQTGTGLFEAGLTSARVETQALEPSAACVLARAPSQPETEVTQ
jgi:hypothetical protein